MIKFNINPRNRQIESLNFHSGFVEIRNVKVKFLQLRDYNDEMNIGYILENHRKYKENKIALVSLAP